MADVLVRSKVRASDDERDGCQRALALAFSEGRLEVDELEQRMGRAAAAVTRADLRELTRDLPMRPARERTAWLRRLNRRMLTAHAATWATLNGGLVGIWAASGQGDFWPGAVVAGTSTILAWHAGTTWAFRRRRPPRDAPPPRGRAAGRSSSGPSP